MHGLGWVGIWPLALCLALAHSQMSAAFNSNGRWSTTATDGATAPLGNPITLTWSIVPDGTTINQQNQQPSDLIALLDGIFGTGPDENSFSARPWFPLIENSFNRWSELGGMTFVHQPTDDGAVDGENQHSHGLWQGMLGTRGDVRLGGTNIDGPGGATAEANFIPDGDITFDTANLTHFNNPGANNDYINLRNTLMHEIGHSLGLAHMTSFSSVFLMESVSNPDFDGPQFDDIRGLHYLYGDALEKIGGNNSLASALDLGLVTPAATMAIGLDGNTGVDVEPDEVDFVSISGSSDLDYFIFSTDAPILLDVVLTPVGPSYNEFKTGLGLVTFDTAAMNDLSLELYLEGTQSPIAGSNLGGLGQAESILDFELSEPGAYYARIAGSGDEVQLYTLEISVAAVEVERLGDFNDDGIVDAADYTLWRDHFGDEDDSAILNRGDAVAGIDTGDFEVWKVNFGSIYGGTSIQIVPEPAFVCNIVAALAVLISCWRRVG